MSEIQEKIPKVIHYCWFGRGERPQIIKDCMKSWKEKCPDYEIIEWNEDNFDVNYCQYTKDAYEAKKYFFSVSYVIVHDFLKECKSIRRFYQGF